MKSYIHILCAVLTAALAACSNNDLPTDGGNDLRSMTISVVTDQVSQTRAETPEVSRYAISVWEDEACTTPANVFTGEVNYVNTADGIFAMILNSTKSYYCLFWADNGTGYTLDNNLQSIALQESGKVSAAYCGKATIPAGTSTAYSATLKRAVAKITLKETNEMPAGNEMAVKFDQYTVFNVQSGMGSTPEPCIVTWTTTVKSGTDDSPVQLNDEDILTLAPVNAPFLGNITFQCNNEGGIMVSNVPLQANYNTNIKGHFTTVSEQSFTVTNDEEWYTPENDIPLNIWDGSTTSVPTGYSEGNPGTVNITSAAELAWLAEENKINNTGFKDYTFLLTTDIDLGCHEWTPIGGNINKFEGMFNGQGHTVHNLKCTASSTAGLFGNINEATLTGVTVTGSVSYSCTSDEESSLGGIAGHATNSTIEDCVNECTVNANGKSSSNCFLGGIAGFVYAKGTLSRNRNTGNITVSGSIPNSLAGGIIGLAQASGKITLTGNAHTGSSPAGIIIGFVITGDDTIIDGTPATTGKPWPVPVD